MEVWWYQGLNYIKKCGAYGKMVQNNYWISKDFSFECFDHDFGYYYID